MASKKNLTYRLVPPRVVRLVLWLMVLLAFSLQLSLTVLLFMAFPQMAGLSWQEMQQLYPAFLWLYAATWLGFVLMLYAVWAMLYQRQRTTLTLEAKHLQYQRPGLPVLGLFAKDVTMPLADIRRLLVLKRRYPFTLLLYALGEQQHVAFNLSEATLVNRGSKNKEKDTTKDKAKERPEPLPKADDVLKHPLVKALEQASGLKAELQ